MKRDLILSNAATGTFGNGSLFSVSLPTSFRRTTPLVLVRLEAYITYTPELSPFLYPPHLVKVFATNFTRTPGIVVLSLYQDIAVPMDPTTGVTPTFTFLGAPPVSGIGAGDAAVQLDTAGMSYNAVVTWFFEE